MASKVITLSVKPRPPKPSRRTLEVQGVRESYKYSHNLDGVHLRGPAYSNGLISTIAAAYSDHARLRLRPDDIMHSLIVHFGVYVNAHPDIMREYLVEHSGTMQISVDAGAKFDPAVDALAPAIRATKEELLKHAPGVAEWATLDFTTTTDLDHTMSDLALMSSVKKFFSYEFLYLCGMSEVELVGTLGDWKKLRAKADFISGINTPVMQKWAAALRPVLDQFVKAYSGDVDDEFWQRICKIDAQGSGGDTTSGWCLVFAPFDKNGNYMTNANNGDIIGIAEVPIHINDNGTEFDIIATVGSRGVYVSADAYEPINGIAIHKPATKEQ